MKKTYFIIPSILVLALILASCATPPRDEMDRAIDAVIRAENDVYAVVYAPSTLVRARQALSRMQTASDTRRFDAARNYASEAINLAERAINEGRVGAAQARAEALALLNVLPGLLDETSSAITAARRRPVQLDFDALSRDLAFSRLTYEDARQSFQDSHYRDALDRAQAARSLLATINTRINEGVQIIARKQ